MSYQVLLVEERIADAELIQEALQQSAVSCSVTHVRRLADALQQSLHARFDAVLLNLSLSDSKGLDTYVAMRSHMSALPLILITNSDSHDVTLEAVKKGAQDYLRIDEISPSVLGKTLLYAIERKRHEHDLRTQKEFYENLLREANVWVEALDRQGNVILWNKGAEKISGYGAETMLSGRSRWELLFPDDARRHELLRQYEAILENERGLRDVEAEIRTASGDIRVLSWNSNIIRGNAGEVMGCMLVGNDITDQRIVSEGILESEQRFRILSELTSDYVYTASIDDEGQYLTHWVEGAFERITGFHPGEIIGRNGAWLEHMFTEDLPPLDEIIRILQEGPAVFEYRIQRKDGSTCWLRDSIHPTIEPESGRVIGVLGAVKDISPEKAARLSEKLAQETLSREEEKLRGIIENSTDGIFLMDGSGKIIEWNPSMERITGVEKTQALRMYRWDVEHGLLPGQDSHGEDRLEQLRTETRDYLETGNPDWLNRLFHRWIERPDGQRRFIEMVSFRVNSSFGMLTGSITRDITEIKLAEQDIEEKNRRLQTLIRTIPDMIYFKNAELRNILANQAYADFAGRSIDDLVGKTEAEYLPPDLARQGLESDREVLTRGTTLRREESIIDPDSGTERWFETVKTPLFGAEGETIGLIGVSRDITERKQAELLLAGQNAELRERNDELDTFTHSVAHDLKNPLSLILGYADMVQYEGGAFSAEELHDYMGSILFNGRKMIAIINSLLLLASVRQEDVVFERIEMRQIVNDALRRMQKQIADNGILIELPDEWYAALGYAPWIEEVWVNYIGNAVKHGGKGRRIVIGAEQVPGGMLRYSVTDDGPGIPADHLGELFLPFTRLSQAKIEGHGLGLSIVRRIIEKTGGEVDVVSEEGRGATFSFTLPEAGAGR